MTQQISLKHGDILHAGFTGPIQELLSAATANFRILVLNNTTLQITAGTDDLQRGIAIKGRYRFRSTETTAVIPGALANGEHPVFVTASDNNFTGPIEEPDITVHTFGLEVKKAGETPSTAIYREVGKVKIEGGVIVGFRQTVGSVAGPQIEDGAMANTSVITWTRNSSGALVATITALPKTALDEDTNQRLWQTGDLKPTMLKTAPTGWLLCNFAEVSRTTFPALWLVMKETGLHNGNGTTTFNTPDGRGANFVGVDSAGVNMKTIKPALGAHGGEELHKLLLAEIPFHGHGVSDPSHAHGAGSYFVGALWQPGQQFFNEFNTHSPQSGFNAVTTWGASGSSGVQGASSGAVTGITVIGAGGGGSNTEPAHNNMAPFFTGNWLIKT